MSSDHKPTTADELVSRPRRAPPGLVLAGVAAAVVLGAGLGLWARPSDVERDPARRPADDAAALLAQPRRIEIRVDRPPPPVAPHAATPAPAPPPPRVAPETGPLDLAPRRAPEGLVRVRAVAPPRLADAPAAARRAKDSLDEQREAREARAEAAAARKLKAEKARRAEAAEEDRARRKAEQRLVERKAAERKARRAAVEAQEARAAARVAEQKARRARAPERTSARVAEASRKAPPKAAVPVRTVKASARCASPDPGAALACADPSLGAAERQLARAYRQAEAAGVPPDKLERQQRRWLAARANAARQAPWAVHDVYLARIAELQDQTRAAAPSD